LQERLFETVGRGVPVTSAKAGIDDVDVHQVTDYLNSEEGKDILENMKAWPNNLKLRFTSSSGKDVYIHKKKRVAMVFDR
jgi:hypothetical protein